MEIHKLATLSEVEECVDMYRRINDENFMPSDRKVSIAFIHKMARGGRFVRVLKRDGVIVAWICAEQCRLNHTDLTYLQQLYYVSEEHGFLAYRYLVALHEAMYKYGCSIGVDYCMAGCNPADIYFVLSRALEKNGWIRKGYLAFKETVGVPRKDAPTGRQVGRPRGGGRTPMGAVMP